MSAGWLDELQRLCDAATPGPWTFVAAADHHHEADAQFAIAARDALPKLIARERRHVALVQRVREWCDQFSEYEDPAAEATLDELRALVREAEHG